MTIWIYKASLYVSSIFIMADDDVWNIKTSFENWKALLCF